MRLAVLSDVHANLEALEAVLHAVEGHRVDATYVLGDIVGYGADPGAVVERLRSVEGAVLLAGNHDLAATGRFDDTWFNSAARAAIRWTADTMEADALSFLAGLEPSRATHVGLCVHGSVVEPATEYVVNVDAALKSFEASDFQRCFFGHTHLPTIFFTDGDGHVDGAQMRDGEPVSLSHDLRYMLNPGSVGQPRDSDPRASFMIVDDEASIATVHRVQYPLERTQAKIREAGLPPMLAERLSVGR